jgi:hypothetical protein
MHSKVIKDYPSLKGSKKIYGIGVLSLYLNEPSLLENIEKPFDNKSSDSSDDLDGIMLTPNGFIVPECFSSKTLLIKDYNKIMRDKNKPFIESFKTRQDKTKHNELRLSIVSKHFKLIDKDVFENMCDEIKSFYFDGMTEEFIVDKHLDLLKKDHSNKSIADSLRFYASNSVSLDRGRARYLNNIASSPIQLLREDKDYIPKERDMLYTFSESACPFSIYNNTRRERRQLNDIRQDKRIEVLERRILELSSQIEAKKKIDDMATTKEPMNEHNVVTLSDGRMRYKYVN